tara:strand:- start:2 stop:421 length:420 start_codon:yes stop_codon:yes gene_type:complete
MRMHVMSTIIAGLTFFVFGYASWHIGERFPFSRYDMYAHPAVGGAVPVIQADGKWVPLSRLRDIHGIDPEQLQLPVRVAGNMEFRIEEIQDYIRANRGNRPGPVAIRIGFTFVRMTDEVPVLDEHITVIAEGSATVNAR